MDGVLSEEVFCQHVERLLQRERDLAAQVSVSEGRFVVRLQLRDLEPVTWSWPVDEPAYDRELGGPMSEEQAYYLATLAVEENTAYIHQDLPGVGLERVNEGVVRRRWWRRR